MGPLFAEAGRLRQERDELLAEQIALAAGTGDPAGRQPAIDAKRAELAEPAALLEQNRQDRAGVSEQLLANHDAQQAQQDVQRAALSAADDRRAEAVAAGCEWAVGPDPEEPETPEDDGGDDSGGDPGEDPGGDSGGGAER